MDGNQLPFLQGLGDEDRDAIVALINAVMEQTGADAETALQLVLPQLLQIANRPPGGDNGFGDFAEELDAGADDDSSGDEDYAPPPLREDQRRIRAGVWLSAWMQGADGDEAATTQRDLCRVDESDGFVRRLCTEITKALQTRDFDTVKSCLATLCAGVARDCGFDAMPGEGISQLMRRFVLQSSQQS
ncbi:MAG: hypothetical protein MHM6MM_005871, partial [Cercozoa sp. M6MM]